jgi:hypothetical protein
MLKAPPPGPEGMNMLLDVHCRLMNLPLDFRKRVSQECSWSIPTFYRKMRGHTSSIPALSNAERDMILAVFDELFDQLWVYMERYRKKP